MATVTRASSPQVSSSGFAELRRTIEAGEHFSDAQLDALLIILLHLDITAQLLDGEASPADRPDVAAHLRATIAESAIGTFRRQMAVLDEMERPQAARPRPGCECAR